MGQVHDVSVRDERSDDLLLTSYTDRFHGIHNWGVGATGAVLGSILARISKHMFAGRLRPIRMAP
jgi:hypothetical protein